MLFNILTFSTFFFLTIQSLIDNDIGIFHRHLAVKVDIGEGIVEVVCGKTYVVAYDAPGIIDVNDAIGIDIAEDADVNEDGTVTTADAKLIVDEFLGRE